MTITEKIKKLKVINQGIISSFFIAEQYWQILSPLLDDPNVYSRWNYSEGVMGAKVLRMALFTSIIVDMHASLFDKNNKSGSLKKIIDDLGDKNVKQYLKDVFSTPDEIHFVGNHSEEEIADMIKTIQKQQKQELGKEFECLHRKVIEDYDHLEKSDLASRIKKARDKIFAHKEVRQIDDERRFFDVADNDISISFYDAKELLNASKIIIFNTNKLLEKSVFSLDILLDHHRFVASEFWRKM
ncbi:MAG: hypothetical protein GVY04_11535 [Cyanobacteria bacterium]|jgi:hypothetical protein|nr:hypothetical protein [Cyanobacteria bacterium GSL.Bin1]